MRAGAAAVLALAAGCTAAKWTAPPRAAISFEATAAVEQAIAAEVPQCPRERVYVDAFKDLIQASGCDHLMYLRREGTTWKRVGPVFDLPPGNDLREAEAKLIGATLRQPVKVTGVDPFLTLDQAKTLHSWSPRAVATCLLGIDGELHGCFIQADEAVVRDAVDTAMKAVRYKPATANGQPVPATFQVVVNVPVPRPNCDAIGDPLQEARCDRDLRSPGGPAAADPSIWDLPLGQ